MVSPDVNTIFLPITVESIQEAHFARGYAGFVAAVGYLSMRFLYSSSKVQIGTVVLVHNHRYDIFKNLQFYL